MIRFRPADYGRRVPLAGSIQASWWGGFEHTVFEDPEPSDPYPTDPYPPEDVAYSSSITRPACACKILGQGCAVPQGGTPTGGAVSQPSDGPSTVAVVGGISAVALLGLLVAGVI